MEGARRLLHRLRSRGRSRGRSGSRGRHNNDYSPGGSLPPSPSLAGTPDENGEFPTPIRKRGRSSSSKANGGKKNGTMTRERRGSFGSSFSLNRRWRR